MRVLSRNLLVAGVVIVALAGALFMFMGKDTTVPGHGAVASLTRFSGEPEVLQSYAGHGKWLVVMIWRSDCLICNKEAESYVQMHERHKDKDMTVLGISTDGSEGMADARAFMQRHHVTFPNLIASGEQVVGLYSQLVGDYLTGTPTFLIFNPEGELKAAQVGAVPVDIIEDYISKNS